MFDPVILRQQLHQKPEIAFQEHQTKAILKTTINEIVISSGVKDSFELIEFATSTAMLLVYNGGDDAYRLFRADMDALPTDEATGCEFPSQNSGMMHACGHDVHMAILMGLIQRVWIKRPKTNLLFLFQPAEEGQGGAQSVLAEGIIQKYNIAKVHALHVASDLPVGTISSKAGTFFGIPQEFDVRFYGTASHVAFPEKGINAMAAGIAFFNSIKQDLAKLSESERIIYHVGKMTAGKIRNIIADECILEGTHRSLNPLARDRMNEITQVHAKKVAEEINARYEVKLLNSYDPVVNDGLLVEALIKVCESTGYSYVPAETVMTGEDFGFFTTMYPGLLFWLGSGCNYPLHSEKFLPRAECIEVGINVMWGLVQSK